MGFDVFAILQEKFGVGKYKNQIKYWLIEK